MWKVKLHIVMDFVDKRLYNENSNKSKICLIGDEPMKTIFIMMDTLNRRMLDIYNSNAEDTAFTPNIRRLAARGVVCDNLLCKVYSP